MQMVQNNFLKSSHFSELIFLYYHIKVIHNSFIGKFHNTLPDISDTSHFILLPDIKIKSKNKLLYMFNNIKK